MTITVKYKGVSLTFDKMPTPVDIQRKYEELYTSIPTYPVEPHYPLLPAQEQLWFFDQLEPGSPVYNIPMLYRLEGTLNRNALEQALQDLVDRHGVLRTSFVRQGGVPVQIVSESVTLKCRWTDLSNLPEEKREAELKRLIEEEITTGFQLNQAPLLRAQIVKEGSTSHVLMLNVHHIVFDGWSVGVMLQELDVLYQERKKGGDPALKPLKVQFVDYVRWFREREAQGELVSQREYWRSELKGELPVLDLVTDYVRPPVFTYAGCSRERMLSKEQVERLRGLCQEHGVTLNMLVLAALAVLLKRFTGQDDVILGTPVAGRTKEELSHLIGYFVNMIPFRLMMSGEMTFLDLLALVKDKSLSALQNQEYSFKSLIEDLNPVRDLRSTPIFQAIMTYVDQTKPVHLGDLQVTALPVPQTTVKFDLGFGFVELADGMKMVIDYRTDLYKAETIDRMLDHLNTLLDSISREPNELLDRLNLLQETQREELIHGWNQTSTLLPDECCVQQLVEKQVRLNPDQVAVRHRDRTLTYAELNQTANRLAHWLRKQGIGTDDVVTLLVEQGIEAVVAMLGVLKAGGAYMPLDPSHPKPRLEFMIRNAGSKVVLTLSHLRHLLDNIDGVCLLLDSESETLAREASDDLNMEGTGEQLVNVLYTSGSTGIPKAVALPHRGVIRLVHQANFAKLDSTDVTLQISALHFDGATFEIWGTLCNGGTLVIVDREVVLSPKLLGVEIEKHGVTTLVITTPLLNRLIEDAPQALSSLRRVIFGGEAVSKAHIQKALEIVKPGVLINTYGPTENSFTSCYFPIHQVEESAWTIPIGYPVSHTELYVLDSYLQPVPYGVVGEIYIGGRGLACGYLNDEERTAEAFLPNPFSDEPGARLYKTGDRGRRLSNGSIEFIGRLDNQVKIRSHRVELGEVEAAINRFPQVKECFVTTTEGPDGIKQLVAYYVSSEPEEAGMETLRAYLRQTLPDYMVPHHLVSMSALPLNPNGKVNRRELPNPQTIVVPRKTEVPRNTVERKIAEIWKDVLKLPQVGLEENFFDLGGHSLLIVKVQAAIKEEFGIEVPLLDLFKYTTVRTLADVISGEEEIPKLQIKTNEFIAPFILDRDVAIIGIGLRFPGADSPEAFWDNLIEGRESIQTIPEEELDPAPFNQDPLLKDRLVRAGGFVDNLFQFDPEFFGMSEREALLMDPQHRLFLQCAYEAAENAGYDLFSLDRTVSLYACAAPSTYLQQVGQGTSITDEFQRDILSQPTFLATRVSYKLNLRGESVMIDTACSSSLVAVHMACQSLILGQSDYALAGGVSIKIPQKSGYLYEQNFILSPDGHCRAFDKNAEGTVEGNGVGVVFLKRLQDALLDGDPIYAVITGSAINNDGNAKIGYTAPSLKGQMDVIVRAQHAAGVTPDKISYIEAHGTGTRLGDPIEASALKKAFNKTDGTPTCAIGSVKTNIGHLGSAAGIAGLIKTALALKNKEIPPSLHFQELNPEIDFSDSPFYVCSQRRPWTSGQEPRRAGVSSFGIGGTNAHVILEEAPTDTEVTK